MTEYNIKLKQSDLVALLTENNTMANMIEEVVNQVLEAQMTEHLGAGRYAHDTSRQGYRNGHRVRQLYTRVGTLTLRVPQARDGSFSTELFKRYQRSEQALLTSLMEMYLQGVSTRKVTKITEALCGSSFSKSTVSALCVELDARISAWKKRRFDDKRYPFLIVDALVTDVRRDHAVRSTGVLVAYGINEQGYREVLGFTVADSETECGWRELFKDLKQRGLSGVDLVVSDAHTGLNNAIKTLFQGAQWQRCQVHFMRNILGLCPRHCRKEMASQLKLVFTAQDKQTARELAKKMIDNYEQKAPKAVDCLENGLEDALTILQLPQRYRQRLRTSNLAERVNEEIRRREKVVRIFPNEKAAERLIGAILAQTHDAWLEGNRYFDMNEYLDFVEEQNSREEKNLAASNVVAIAE